MSEAARLIRLTGALAEAAPLEAARLFELVRVGPQQLFGEIVQVIGTTGTIVVYEDTTGLRLNDVVNPTGEPLTVELGPGLLGAVLDGVGRSLGALAEQHGDWIQPGARAFTLDQQKKWKFTPTVAVGASVSAGDVLGEVEEQPDVRHRVLLPPAGQGVVARISSGEYTVSEPFGALEDGTELKLAQHWPVRLPRPIRERLAPDRPFLTGQRVFDLLFTAAEGGAVALPGGFGTGKTVVEQSLAKYSEADVVVYVGCGERGNEMAEVLHEFPKLQDPKTGRSIMDRTVLVVNTSNMPVAARESSIHLGITIAEYYRDQGYRVAVMVDSISRWAEALREFGARMQEMPGEEGFPTYLANRLGKFYERAGRATALGSPERGGAVTVISAISPPGGDLSEPVTQAALRVVGGLWALDAALAHQRHFPAVDWQTSYSLFAPAVADWFTQNIAADWMQVRGEVMELLQREAELREIAGLIGMDALQDRERILLECARLIREAVLTQSAYDPVDASCPAEKTYQLARAGLRIYDAARQALDAGATIEQLPFQDASRALLAYRAAPPDRSKAANAALEQAIAQISAVQAAA